MQSIARKRGKGKVKVVERRKATRQVLELFGIDDLDVRVGLIQSLIPIGLKHVNDELQKEVLRLAGPPRKHGKVNTRWGRQGGSVYLLDQKTPLDVPRVRSKLTNQEVPLESYHKFQAPHEADERLFLKLLNGLSTHKYEESAALAPQVFGISASSVSKRFRTWSKKHLKELMTRSLHDYDFVAIFIDGKAYAKDGLVIAMGITIAGKKVILGLEQMNTENSRCVGQFIDKLKDRSLHYQDGLLVIVDGSKGIIRAVREKLNGYALLQRYRQHKRENVVSYLPKELQKLWRIKLSQAWSKDTLAEAEAALKGLCRELEALNPSAAESLKEGMSDTLTLHRLGLNRILERSFSSTNCIESLLAQLGQFTDKVDRWRGGRHVQEWAASGLLRIEPRLRKICGWRYLPRLREALRRELKLDEEKEHITDTELVCVGA
mgnify:CR=1 FL=1